MVLTQSLAELDIIYGKDERKAMLENFKFTVLLGCKDTETQEYFSKIIADQRSPLNDNDIRPKPIIKPADLAHLGQELFVICDDGANRGQIDHAANIQNEHEPFVCLVQDKNIPHFGIGQQNIALAPCAVTALAGDAADNVNCGISAAVQLRVRAWICPCCTKDSFGWRLWRRLSVPVQTVHAPLP